MHALRRVACVLAIGIGWGCALATDLGGLGTDGGSTDAPQDVSSDGGDAGPPRCDPATKFTPIGAVAGLASPNADEVMVRLTPNELEAYVQYGSTADGGTPSIMHLDRADTTKPFANAASIGPLQPLPFGVTSDGLELVAGSNLTYDWTRSSTASNFSGGAQVQFGGVAATFYQPFIVGGGSRVLYGEQYVPNADGGTYVLARSERSDAGWSALAAVGLANDPTNAVLFPVLSDDERVIYFSKVVAKESGANHDAFVATRANVTDSFGAPTPVTELNTMNSVHPSWISPDLCHLYYIGDKSGYDVYFASRAPP